MSKEVITYRVGAPFPISGRLIPNTTGGIITPSGIDLIVCLTRPTTSEIKKIRRGEVELGLFIHPNAPLTPFITCDIPKVIEFDQPFDCRLEAEMTDLFLNSEDGYANVFHLHLVDENSTIRAMRMLAVNQDMAKALHDVFMAQLSAGIGIDDDLAITALQNAYTSQQMHKMACCKHRFKRKKDHR